jgi:hypothetical protein
MDTATVSSDIRSPAFVRKLYAMAARTMRQFPIRAELDELVNSAWLLVAEGLSPSRAVRMAHDRMRQHRGFQFVHDTPDKIEHDPHSVDEVGEWSLGRATSDGTAE